MYTAVDIDSDGQFRIYCIKMNDYEENVSVFLSVTTVIDHYDNLIYQ